MSRSHPPPAAPDLDDEAPWLALQTLLDRVPAPCTPLDVSALDGYLCGVLLQPAPPPTVAWLRWVLDVDGREPLAGFDAGPLRAAALRRHAALQRAIGARDWFDPWVFELDEAASASECVLPWVAGFAAAMERFPGLMQVDDPQLLEPLGLIYLHFDADDLEDADALQEVIETLEPPADLAEAVQDLVRSVMLLADVTHPRPQAPAPRRR